MEAAVLLTYRSPPLGEHPRVSNASLEGQDPTGLTRKQFNTICGRLGFGHIEDSDVMKIYLKNFNSIRSHFKEATEFGLQS